MSDGEVATPAPRARSEARTALFGAAAGALAVLLGSGLTAAVQRDVAADDRRAEANVRLAEVRRDAYSEFIAAALRLSTTGSQFQRDGEGMTQGDRSTRDPELESAVVAAGETAVNAYARVLLVGPAEVSARALAVLDAQGERRNGDQPSMEAYDAAFLAFVEAGRVATELDVE